MKGRNFKRTILYLFCSLGLFALLFGLTYRERNVKDQSRAPKLVVFGDSIMGECRYDDGIPARIGKRMNMRAMNAAFGGTRMCRADDTKRLDNNRDGLSMAALSKAMVSKDFGVQQMVHINEGGTDFFDELIDTIAVTDFSKMEILILEYGINDYHMAVPLDNPENPFDEYTFLGATRSAVTTLKKAYPDARIVLVTPTYSWYLSQNLTCETYDTGNGTLEKYVNAQLETAKELDVEIVDLYHDFYPHEKYEDWEKYTRDGIHPNEKGRKKIAKKIANYLKGKEE